ncbi:hypothetical protein N656DRAFT_770412 [Canariomyces notabilis]|uniref:Clr5 domain-containing protein n=1 Tax=Canariomyces notabilis TaxID=2074819 RepID=A0AAN6QMN7_9PEZI|nr:hypothetical protein N656DRAFT_770412 [Canariomyces arenarius]
MDASQAQHQDGDPPEGWEQHKEAITRFYLEEDLPIAEVMKRMEREYGFYANRRQYLYRFLNWGIKKNIRAEIMIFIAITRERRLNEQGKRTAFVYNGREVDEAKIDRFVRERFNGRDLNQMPLDQRTKQQLQPDSYTPHPP